MFELIFITSNNEKLAHSKYLARAFDIHISKQKNYGVGYKEPRIQDREQLIKQSIQDARERFSKTVSNSEERFFFIEDTSVIIEALSNDIYEVPGVDIKYWMQENSFQDIDKLLKSKGNNRSVIVRSDIILALPLKLQEKYDTTYKVFTSSTRGEIVSKELDIRTQPLYPWLSHKTFNKWFIPDGENVPISTLNIEKADKHDFRKAAFNEMLDFLEKEEEIREKNPKSTEKTGRQLAFFAPSIFIICGLSCAGKTTLANYVLSKYSYYHIEASDFMYLNYFERHGAKSTVEITSFASDVLKEDPGIVVNRILNHIKKLKSVPIMITGFRSPDEIDLFVKNYSGELVINSVFIEANQKIRYDRSIIRNREDSTGSFEDFSIKDNAQNEMGLNTIKELLEEATIINENSISEYFKEFETVYGESLEMSEDWIDPSIYRKSTKKLEQAILKALLEKKEEDNYYTTTEISHLINELNEYKNTPKAKDNVSRYFNQNFHPYYEILFDKELDKLSYRLSNTGLSRAKWLFEMKQS